MDKRKEANIRVKSNIIGALTELMGEKKFEDISVCEITSRAQVSRISYYRNFDSKEDILTESLKALIENFTDATDTLPAHTPVRRVMTVFFRTARENAALFNLLHQAGMDRQIQENLDGFVRSCPHFPFLDSRRVYPACLFSGALFRLLLQWYDTGMTENDTELSNIFCQYMDGLL